MISPRQFLDRLRQAPDYRQQIVYCRVTPARPARHAVPDPPLPGPIAAALAAQGIASLYGHQVQALALAREGADVTIVTGPASGKSLCYHLPVAESLLANPDARALYLYPTKALAQDQLTKLRQWSFLEPFRPATYDGDTPREERAAIRRLSRVLLTNPDMLHVGILPNHPAWAHFLTRLRWVVIDEVHAYRGIFGSHVALVLRRLRRLCEHYGSRPQFLCTSATIANPRAHVTRLIGRAPEVVDDDGAPRGERWFVVWNPTLLDPVTGLRRSANRDATALLVALIEAGHRTLVFTRARVVAELILRYTRRLLEEKGRPDLAERVAAYRAGYLAPQRRELEQRLFRGDLLGMAATVALELGVDIGGLDAVVMVGFPGTIASLWQQGGRAGRSHQPSLAILVTLDNPLDQFLAREPEFLSERTPEQATIHPENPYLLIRHLCCAAVERAIRPHERELFGPATDRLLAALVEAGQLQPREERLAWCGAGYPAADVDLRNAGGMPFTIHNQGPGDPILGMVDAEAALRTVYPGAIYLHQGESYEVTALDWVDRRVEVRPVNVNYYTRPMIEGRVEVITRLVERPLGLARVGYGEVAVEFTVTGYRRLRMDNEQILDETPLDLPPRRYDTMAMWLAIPTAVALELADEGRELHGSIHAIEHTLAAVAPLAAMCDRNDVGGISTPFHPDLELPAVFLHDTVPGGVGIAERCYEVAPDLLGRALAAIAGCPCADGCPGCVHSPTCSAMNRPMDKAGAVWLLRRLLAPERSAPPTGNGARPTSR